jgi:3-mercaptopyruvate sulfurtransferase SseA
MPQLEKALSLSAEEFERTYRIAKPKPADPVIFFCKGGVRASEANDFIRFFKYIF